MLVVLLLFLITLRPPEGRVRRRRSDNATPRATIKSLLLLRLVPSFDRDHGPEDLEQPEADEEERAPGERELREGARLALRPARGMASLSTPSTRRPVRRLDGVEGASSTPPRRGPPVDCRTGATGRPPCRRTWIYLLLWALAGAHVAGRPPALMPVRTQPTAEWHVLARRALVPSVSAPVVATG